MGKGSRLAFQSGILLLCAWICKPIITLDAEAIQVRPGAQQQSDKPSSAVSSAPTLLHADWLAAKRAIRGPVDPFTYRPAAKETPAHRIVEMLLSGPGVDWARSSDPPAADPVTRRFLDTRLRPVVLQASRRP